MTLWFLQLICVFVNLEMILCVLLFKDKQVIHYILGLGMNEKIIIAMFEAMKHFPTGDGHSMYTYCCK